MEIINLDTWERTIHYKFFKRMDYPHYNIGVNIDITNFLDKIEENKIPFYYAMIYAATYALNQVKEFRYRIRGEQVVLHNMIHPSFADMSDGTELFKMVTVSMEKSILDFTKKAKEKSKNQMNYFVIEDVEGRDDLTYITCVPWMSFTHLSHTISFNKDDSIPRLAWGKHFKESDKLLLPFSVQAHHSFVDGIHMGKYIDCLQEYLNEYR
ncbi:chloramphenicol acetyltransferase [hydrocarbon metagenome]|uniref:Chloramphenicol acetyltransferase n=1 Tax=hydrocarbon metagenome TaxID=938273 RepID=A0A0W8EAQ4_9ZZZZ